LARPVASHKSTSRSEEQGDLTKTQEEIINRVEKLAKEKGWTMSQVALAWIGPQVSSPIIGFSSTKRIDEAIGVKGKTLTEEEIKHLNEPYEPRAIEGHA
jgi:aryl-alcohol dehydrogenase-like predicted oxidoreductase